MAVDTIAKELCGTFQVSSLMQCLSVIFLDCFFISLSVFPEMSQQDSDALLICILYEHSYKIVTESDFMTAIAVRSTCVLYFIMTGDIAPIAISSVMFFNVD